MASPTDGETETGPQAEVPGADAATVIEVVEPSAPEYIRLPLGAALTEGQTLAMAADRSVRIVVLAGAVDCGKTTLLASLYELFQSGPIKTVSFAGCNTLPAFEERCHLSRIESEKASADTSRTSYEGPHPEYLHLKIQSGESDTEQIDFLFTDVSGEMFEHARNSTEECKQLTFLQRASHLVVFLDCGRALIVEKRWEMVQEVKSLFQSCLDSGMLSDSCCCTVIWSKCDFFEAARDKAAVADFVNNVEVDLKESFGGRLPNLKFHRTAARPARFPNLKIGFGVRELLNDWITIWPQGRAMQLQPPVEIGGMRESEHFAKRQNGKSGDK